jgi:apolipoprotein D and lipocalin family protein
MVKCPLIPHLTLVALVLGACAGVPKDVQPVDGFELARYLGTWHEIARLDHRFERGLTHVTATYTMRDDGGVRVVNRGFRPATGEWEEAVGRAYFVGTPGVASLKVSFFGPFYGGYNVIDLDRDGYQYALVCGPSRSYLWILARQPALAEPTVRALVEKARGLGFPVDDLLYVAHDQGRTP